MHVAPFISPLLPKYLILVSILKFPISHISQYLHELFCGTINCQNSPYSFHFWHHLLLHYYLKFFQILLHIGCLVSLCFLMLAIYNDSFCYHPSPPIFFNLSLFLTKTAPFATVVFFFHI